LSSERTSQPQVEYEISSSQRSTIFGAGGTERVIVKVTKVRPTTESQKLNTYYTD